ncbi:MAG TPA: outer membrane protein assembly factor BamD, partial [Nitrospiraceae bacterium]|nr:outer membrane protein assembly factor BamD [Nitrospiraceae bacterium]
ILAFRLLLAASVVAVGCSSTPKKTQSGSQALSGTDEQIFIGDTVEKNYDPNVIMKRAEAFFDKEDYPEAIIEYQHFLDLHRIHVLAPYAQYKLGESHFKIAKTIDRDLEPIYKALEAFEKLRKDYPGSKYDAEAVERIRAAHDWIAQAYFFVGQFYYRREAYLAAAHRFDAIVKEYPEVPVAPDAMYYLALSYHEIGADDWAQEKLIALAQQYPENKYKTEGQQLLAKLMVKQPATAVALAEVSSNGTSVAQNSVLANGLNESNGSSSQTAVQPLPASAMALTPVNAASSASPKVASASHDTLARETILCHLGTWCGDSSNGVSIVQNGARANGLNGSNGSSSKGTAQAISASGIALTQVRAALPTSPKVAPASPSTLTPQTTLCHLGTWC